MEPEVACVLLQQIVEDPLMRHSAILVFANKQDLVGPFCTSLPYKPSDEV